jgi:DNA-binding beta-propeller fold protein YncE
VARPFLIGFVVLIALAVDSRRVGIDAQSRSRSVPEFEVEKAWPQVPPKWKLGDASSFAIDDKDNVWLLHRPRTVKAGEAAAPPVVVFDTAGTFVKAWGGEDAGTQWPEREHGIHVDAKGFVWITGNNCPTNGIAGLKPVNDDQILKLTGDGKVAMRIGESNGSKGNADTRNVHRAADVWVHPASNELYVADGYGNHRVVVFDAETGAFKRMWGAFGNKPVDDDHCEVVTPKTFPAGDGPPNFSIVHALRVANDGMVYVADRENRRVQTFTPNGTFVKQLVKTDTQFARNLALSHDPGQQFLYIGNGMDIVIVDRRSLEIVSTIEVPGMIGGGHQIAVDSKGNLYIAGTTAGLQKLTFKGMAVPKS